mgnify:FL=1
MAQPCVNIASAKCCGGAILFLFPAFGAFPQDFFAVALKHPPRPRMSHIRGTGDVRIGGFRGFPRAADTGHEVGDVEPCAPAVVDMDIQPVADVGELPAGRSLAGYGIEADQQINGRVELTGERLTAASRPNCAR